MNEILDPLTVIPGVRFAALITPDGVPISLSKGRGPTSSIDRGLPEGTDDFAAYAGLAVGWLGQVARATDPLTWNRPRRAVLRGTRGTLIMNRAESAILMVILEQGVGAEELRLPMESALARMQRHLRGGSARPGASGAPGAAPSQVPHAEVPSLLPRRPAAPEQPDNPIENCFSESTGDK